MANNATKFGAVALGSLVTGALIGAVAANSLITRGDIVFDTTSNSSPAVQLSINGGTPMDALGFETDGDVNTGSGDVISDTYRNPESCTGFTGALICTRLIKLTGSGGARAHNAGSFQCLTTTCSILESRAIVESGADLLYGGWTNSPGSQSGTQLFNRKLVKNGLAFPGSGGYVIKGTDSATITTVTKDVPPGATVKFQWDTGNGTEDYSRTKAAVWIRYAKFYVP